MKTSRSPRLSPPAVDFPFFRSLRSRFLALLVGLTLVGSLATVILAIGSARTTGSYALETASEKLRSQTEVQLTELTRRSARENDLILDNISRSVQEAGALVLRSMTTPELGSGESFWSGESRMARLEGGQYSNDAQDVSSVYLPNTTPWTPAVLQEIQTTAYLDLFFPSLLENTPSIEAVYFATPSDIVRYYPNVKLGEVLPPDFRASQRPWFAGSVENTRQSEPWWTPAYLDATGLGVVTTAAMPVYKTDSALLGVVGFDVTLTEMKANIEQSQFYTSGYNFLVDEQGRAIALPEAGYRDLLGDPKASEFGADLNQARPEFQPILARMLAGEAGFAEASFAALAQDGENRAGETVFIAYAPLPSTGWSLGSVVRASDVLGEVASLQASLAANTRQAILARILPFSALTLLVTIVAGLYLTNRTVRPIQELAKAADKLGAGEWETQIPFYAQAEIGALAEALRTMRGQLYRLFQELEDRVKERTLALERRAVQLQAAAEVGHSAATILDLDELLTQVTHLISDRFGFYHAGIFLIDEAPDRAGKYAVLRAANSPGGQNMLARRHRLLVGQEGIVGLVTASGEPHIALDVGADAVFFNNPDLPETRSEMALPLRVGDQILGALDVQSQAASAFSQEDITVLQVLADQVAVAIQNARLFAENQQALQTAQRAYSQLSGQTWEKILAERGEVGFVALPGGRIETTGGEWKPDAVQAAASGQVVQQGDHTLALPIVIRGQVTGAVHLKKAQEAARWSEAEQKLMSTLAEQLGVALESAQLYEESQRRAERERLASEITARVRASNDPATILQTAVTELRRALNARRTQVLVSNQPAGEAGSSGQNGGAAGKLPAKPEDTRPL